jgi:hypothetical protein
MVRAASIRRVPGDRRYGARQWHQQLDRLSAADSHKCLANAALEVVQRTSDYFGTVAPQIRQRGLEVRSRETDMVNRQAADHG